MNKRMRAINQAVERLEKVEKGVKDGKSLSELRDEFLSEELDFIRKTSELHDVVKSIEEMMEMMKGRGKNRKKGLVHYMVDITTSCSDETMGTVGAGPFISSCALLASALKLLSDSIPDHQTDEQLSTIYSVVPAAIIQSGIDVDFLARMLVIVEEFRESLTPDKEEAVH